MSSVPGSASGASRPPAGGAICGRQRQIEAAASYSRNATTAATIAVATATCSAVSWKAPIAAASTTTPPRQIRYARDAIAMWK